MTAWADKIEKRLAALEGRPVNEQYPAVIRKDVELLRQGVRDAQRIVAVVSLGTISYEDPITQTQGDARYDPIGAAAAGLAAAWPVGSIFISAVSTNPATLLGFGTWSAIGAGRVLVGQDTGDPDFDVLGDTGGAKTVAATGSNSAPTFTGDALGTHTHTVTSNVAVADHASHTHTVTPTGAIVWPAGVPTFAGDAVVAATDSGATHLFVEDLTGTGKSPVTTATGTISWPGGVPTFNGNNVVTAGPSATLSHGVTNNAVTSGATSAGTPSGTVSAPTFTGSATSVVQPYLVVKMWQRTA